MKEVIEISNDSDLQNSFDLFQIEFPYTRLMRHSSMLIYSPRGEDNSKVIKEANDLITRLGLSLRVESGNLIGNKTVVITGYTA